MQICAASDLGGISIMAGTIARCIEPNQQMCFLCWAMRSVADFRTASKCEGAIAPTDLLLTKLSPSAEKSECFTTEMR